MKQRLHWVDISKGLFILLMVLGHISNVSGNHGIDDTYLLKCIFFASLYGCFFMQGFFILTGYTTNFDKDFKPYFKSIFKTLIIPWISFSLITKILQPGDWFYSINGQKFFFLFEDYWFIHALILAKLAYYFIRKHISYDYLRCLILLGMSLLGFIMISKFSTGVYENPYHVNNYFHYKDFLCMTIFLWIGDYFKRKHIMEKLTEVRMLLIIICFYLLGHLIRLYSHFNGGEILWITPVVLSHGSNIESFIQIPAFLYFTILGSLSCFGIAKLVGQCRQLEYFGRGSLVVYCIHFVLLNWFVDIVQLHLTPDDIISAILYTIIVFLMTVISCYAIIKAFKYKPLCFLIGKF